MAERFNPILDVFAECGVKFALEVHPTEIAFDLYTAERALDALNYREEFGFNFDPSHLIWQGVDPVEFIRAFPDRIYHVHMKDAIVTLNGKSGILGSHLNFGDPCARLGLPLAGPRRGQLRGDHPGAERTSATRARCRSSGKTAAWTATTAPARPASSSARSTSSPASWPSTPRSTRKSRDSALSRLRNWGANGLASANRAVHPRKALAEPVAPSPKANVDAAVVGSLDQDSACLRVDRGC